MQVGDRVVLKSGGPVLTVYDLDRYNGRMLAEVRWFDDTGKLIKDHLPPDALKAVENDTDR